MPDAIIMRMPGVARFESRLQGVARRVATDGGKATEIQTRDTREIVVRTSPVDTGFFRDHWGPVTERGSALSWGFENATPYGPTLEYGGYRRAGPRTVALGGGDLGAGFTAGAGIYSRQAPLGFVRKALAHACPPWHRRLENVVRQAWVARDMGGGWPVGPAVPLATGTDLGALFGIDLVGGALRGGLSSRTAQTVRDVLQAVRTRPRGRRRSS